MRSVVIWIVMCLALVGCQDVHNIWTPLPSPPPTTNHLLTVMSYNIRVGYGGKDRGVDPYTLAQRKENLPPIVAAIQSIDPDIVGLQEVRGTGQARRLAERLNMNYAYEWHETGSSRPPWWGVALLSKYPILQAQGVQISAGRGNTKSALVGTVDVAGQRTTVINMHKDKDLTDGSSFKVIMQVIAKIEGPIVLLGDFNMRPQDPRLHLLQERFIDTATAVETVTAQHARNTGTFIGLGRIDYVLVDPGYFLVYDAGIISHEHWQASDHLAYYARVTFKP